MAGDASFENITTSTVGGGYKIIPEELDKLALRPNLSRWDAGEDSELEELVESIAAQGQKQPAIIRKNAQGNAELVAGYRRLAAVKRINADPAKYGKQGPIPLLVRLERLRDEEAIIANLDENLRRKSLSPMDLASYARELERMEWPRKKISEAMRMSPSRVGQLLELFELPREVLDLVHTHKMPESLARKLRGLSPSKIKRAAERIAAGDKAGEVGAEVVEAQREKGKRIGRTLAELHTELKPLVEKGVLLAVQLSEWLSGEPGAAALAEILGEEAEEKAS